MFGPHVGRWASGVPPGVTRRPSHGFVFVENGAVQMDGPSQDVIRRLGEHVAKAAPCTCAHAAAHAVITAPDAIPAEARGRLRLLHGRDL